MKIREMTTVALLTAIPVLIIAIIWVITGPVTFMDRIIVIIIAGGISLTAIVMFAILAIVTAISNISLEDLKEN